LNYDILHLNEGISQMAVKLIEGYSKSHGLKIPDALIGATALYFGIKLFTYNGKDFRFIKDLRLY
jgi:predicted nucleic acid-binding protein